MMVDFQSKYFQIEQLANGVFAAIINRGTGCIGNASVVNLGGKTLVWDTFQNPRAAKELRQFAIMEFGDQPIIVVNSHYHLDHCGGNQVFKDCDILATLKTREIMGTLNQGIINTIKGMSDYPAEYANQVEKETDPNIKKEMMIQLQDYIEISETFMDLQLTLPNMTFDKSMVIHGQNKTAQLLCFGGGHSPSDLVLYLQEDEILLIGDLTTVGSHPLAKHGNVEEWLYILDKLENMPIKRMMPGHGSVVGKEHLKVIQEYFSELIQFAKKAIADGVLVEELNNLPVPDEYSSWRLPHLYTNNLKEIYNYFQSKLLPQM